MAISAEVFEANQSMLWGLCYRMTGNAADADELVQETFMRAIERPPARLDEPLKPWLIRVAINLSRDLLRKRKRSRYVGEWLPSPVPTQEIEPLPSYEPSAPDEDSPVWRYEMLESVSFAFLLALEVLTPTARAVLLLRDVFDYSTVETARALDITEANVKVHLHRARKALQGYNKERLAARANLGDLTRKALEKFLLFMKTRNVEGLEKLLTEDAVSFSDGGGDVYAALNPIRGRRNVLRLLFGLAKKGANILDYSFMTLNGLPALLIKVRYEGEHLAPRFKAGLAKRYTLHCEVDSEGRIQKLFSVLAPKKLTAI
ncbi:MAG: sigma-70 family RNA polymerase sigma factor [Acidobacteriota bacterium]